MNKKLMSIITSGVILAGGIAATAVFATQAQSKRDTRAKKNTLDNLAKQYVLSANSEITKDQSNIFASRYIQPIDRLYVFNNVEFNVPLEWAKWFTPTIQATKEELAKQPFTLTNPKTDAPLNILRDKTIAINDSNKFIPENASTTIDFKTYANDLTGTLYLRMQLKNTSSQEVYLSEIYELSGFHKVDAQKPESYILYSQNLELTPSIQPIALSGYKDVDQLISAWDTAKATDSKKTEFQNSLVSLASNSANAIKKFSINEITKTSATQALVKLTATVSLNVLAATKENLSATQPAIVITKDFTLPITITKSTDATMDTNSSEMNNSSTSNLGGN